MEYRAACSEQYTAILSEVSSSPAVMCKAALACSHRADRAGFCPCLPSTFLPFSFHYGSLCYARCYIYVFKEPLRITLDTGLWAVYQRTDVLKLCESCGQRWHRITWYVAVDTGSFYLRQSHSVPLLCLLSALTSNRIFSYMEQIISI